MFCQYTAVSHSGNYHWS